MRCSRLLLMWVSRPGMSNLTERTGCCKDKHCRVVKRLLKWKPVWCQLHICASSNPTLTRQQGNCKATEIQCCSREMLLMLHSCYLLAFSSVQAELQQLF